MPTKIGIFLKNLRLDSGELTKEMAERLDVSSSFLSKVENGKKDMPESWYEKIVDLYDLDERKQDKLKQAIKDSHKGLIKKKERILIRRY